MTKFKKNSQKLNKHFLFKVWSRNDFVEFLTNLTFLSSQNIKYD